MTCSFSKEFSTSSYTNVENAFIYQYLPVSDGNAVKVYLYGLFLCQNPSFDQPLSSIASALQMEEKEVEEEVFEIPETEEVTTSLGALLAGFKL